jgi:serine/threonine-protein kinase
MATAICAPGIRLRATASKNPNRIGSWIVERELGRGGMASVHGVVHGKLGGRAAIKLAHADMFNDVYTPATFLREARVARAIDHPGIVQIYATGTWEKRPYIVMERIAGESLGVCLDREPMDRLRGLEILIELCGVLGAAHAAGVVHRDLKLDNVILGERVKLVDWGVAYVAGQDDPFRGLIAGTLSYVGPELIRGEDVTPAADVYSLAVLCRRPPFASSSDLALISMHLRTDPPRASCAWADIPPRLDALLLAMLDKNPEARPGLAEVEFGLRDALARLISPRPPRPRRNSWIGIGVAVATAAAAMAGLF